MTHQLEFHAMGSRMLAITDSEDRPTSLQDLPARFEKWEQALSRFRIDSELCELNRHAGVPFRVSQVLWDVFEAARLAEACSRGLVNPLITEALIHAGYDRTFDQVRVSNSYLELPLEAPAVPSLSNIDADAASRSICLPQGAQLDFGGIAKGWAAQQAMLRLRADGPALFSAGGDIAVSGLRGNGEPWEIAVEDPIHQGGYVETLFLDRGGVATSGKDYRHWRRAGIDQHHIIDPRSGVPADTDILTVTVIAPDTMLAEAFAKAVLISGSEAGMAWLDADDSLAGLLVLDNGQSLYSKHLDQYL